MSETWKKTYTCHVLRVGVFQLCVWPVSGKGPFEAWTVIPDDGNSTVLPSVSALDSVDEAKTVIIKRFKRVLTEALVDIYSCLDAQEER